MSPPPTRLGPPPPYEEAKGHPQSNPERVANSPLSPPANSKNSKMSKLVVALLVLCSMFSASDGAKSGEKRVVCYYTNWSAYRQGPAKFLPDNINPYLCTHLVYAFGGLTTEQGIKPFDKYQDIDKGGYTKFNGLKTYNKALKTLIAIGGWNEGSRRFSNLVEDSESRKNFIKHAIRFLRQYHFDGLDLDWEYPASREGGVPEDKKNYAVFIKELREGFEEESKATGRTRLLLTIAVPAGIEWITKGFDIPVINRNVDFFNLLTYDYHASTEPNANHHAPLKARDGLSDFDWKGQLNIEYTINHYLKEGADADKLVVGLPTYGRSYVLFNTDSYDVDAPSSGPGTKGKYTKEPGYLAYYEICEGVKSGDWRVENGDSDTQGPHAIKEDQWVGYDDTRMMAIKGKWVKDNGLGGIMFWSVDNDDFRGTCDGKPFPLIEAAKLAYLTGDGPRQSTSSSDSKLSTKTLNRNTNNRFSTSNRRITTPKPPTTTTGAPGKSRRNKNRNKNRRNKNKKATTPEPTTTTTTEAPTTSNPLSTPAPPTTPDPGVDFECKDDGFFPHPRDCKKYFWCLDAPGLGLVAHHFTCPAGLFFNKNTDSCDYARNVPCKEKKAGEVTTPAPTTPAPTTTTTKATTTTRRTTVRTTTTTEAPEEEYDDEDDEYEDDEEEEPEVTKNGKDGNNNGRSVKEINDIKDLLKLIKKLGGVEELEKYLDENPSVAAVLDEYEEEEAKPKSSTSSTLFKNRNRFTPSATPSRSRFGSSSTTSKSTNPVAASSLKYTSIQRNRPAKVVEKVDTEEEDDDEDSVPKRKSTSTSFTPSTRPKYVTLSRNRDSKSTVEKPLTTAKSETVTEKKSPGSSTETSVVVRFSADEKLLLDEVSSSNKTNSGRNDSYSESAEESSDVDVDDDVEGGDVGGDNKTTSGRKDRYVTFSRPYAKVSGFSTEKLADVKAVSSVSTTPRSYRNKESTLSLRYTQLTRGRTTDLKTEKPKVVKQVKAEDVKVVETEDNEDEEDDEYESDEESDQSIVDEQPTLATYSTKTSTTSTSTTEEAPKTTLATSTTEVPSTTSTSTSTKSLRLRIPTRKTSGFVSRTRGTTTVGPSTTGVTSDTSTSTSPNSIVTSDPDNVNRKAKNFSVGNRRNLFQSRTRPTTASTAVPDAASSQSANDESIAEVELNEADEASNQVPIQRSTRTRSRSISPQTAASSPNEVQASSQRRADINAISRSRSKSRYRSTTEASTGTANSVTTVAPILFRRRSRSSTTPAPTTTTKRTTTTTKAPKTTAKPIILVTKVGTTAPSKKGTEDDDEAEYYYYYYDEDDTSSADLDKDLFAKSQTQRTTGLRAQAFSSPATTSITPGGIVTLTAEKGFTKRNLQTQYYPKSPVAAVAVAPTARTNSHNPTARSINTNSYAATAQIAAGQNSHKWSQRAVVPLSEKIRLRGDGTVECMDKGIFPHPISCKQFVHCVTSEENDGTIRAWVYACPKLLTFDPIGGMCNYDEFAYSKRAPAGNACIE